MLCLSIFVGKHSAQWALDDVLIGMNDSSRTGFHDKFDGTTPLRHNWYRIQGGEVTVDCLSLDTALTFNSEAIDSESDPLLFISRCICRRGLVVTGLSVVSVHMETGGVACCFLDIHCRVAPE